jgi:hypothetical protein
MPNNYQNSKIYTIRCRNDPSLIYVGSTTQPLYKRWGEHKSFSLKHPDRLIYFTINNDWDNWYIELYEECPCENKEQLRKKEGEIIRLMGNLNIKIAGRNQKEYQLDNKNKIKEYQKQYQLENADIKKIYDKEYKIENQDRIKERDKQYYFNNKDKYK